MTETADDVKVVLTQKLLSVNEVFVYRIPTLRSSGGHRAEDWDLAKPLQTCSLVVERKDDSCVVQLFSKKPKEGGPAGATEESLFALCQLDLVGKKTVESFVEAVVDSSRYFAVRISDQKTNRHASIGVGFRERDDASNFRMALQDYERSLQRERTAEAIHMAYEHNSTTEDESVPLPEMGNLTLKEGEKIHIDFKGKSTTIKEEKQPATTKNAALPLLKKPPPPPANVPPHGKVAVGGIDLKDAVSDVGSASAAGSEGAVADLTDDEDWNDFEGSQASS